MIKLPKAADLTAARKAEESWRKAGSYDRAIKAVAEKIEEAHRLGKNSVTVLTVSQDVIDSLRRNGFSVKYLPACGMGDMDSHTITWE